MPTPCLLRQHANIKHPSRSGVVAHHLLHLLLVRLDILLEEVIRLRLGGRLRVRVVEEVLDAEQDLLDRDGGLPALVLVQYAEADGAGGVDVRVEERRDELACTRMSVDAERL